MANDICFRLENIGLVDVAEINLNNLTIIAGKNSVSKTYITYLIFGYLDYIKNPPISPKLQHLINELLQSKGVTFKP